MKHRALTSTLKRFGRGARTLEPFEAYQLWADTYDDVDGNALLAAESAVITPLIAQSNLNGKDVLDAGCGTGRYLDALRKAMPDSLTAIDLSPNMIGKMREKLNGTSEVRLHVADLERLPFRDEEFDFILCTLAIDHIKDLHGAVAEFSRVLQRGGRILISSFHPFGALLGWRRTFKSEHGNGHGGSFAVKYYPHTHSDYFRAFQRSGLNITGMHEPKVTEQLRPMYERAARLDLYKRSLGFPLVLIFELTKQ
jgi:malonyl-CoA O-methyltransferase